MSTATRSPGRPRDPALDDAILDTALRLLAEQGYARMSVDAVAAAAGVSKSTIYRRFPTKADLATAAVASMIDERAHAPRQLELEDALTWTLERLAERLRNPHSMALVGTLLVEEEQTPELIELFRERVWERRSDTMREVLERARARGELDPELDAELVIGMLCGALYSAHIGTGSIPKDWPRRAVRAALDGVRKRV